MLAAIIIGLIVGILARFLMPGRDPMGFIMTAVLGMVGAALMGWLGRSLGWYAEGEPAGFLAAVVGAMIVLGIYRAIIGRPKLGTR